MADNVQLDDNTTAGAVVRAIEKSGKIHPVSVLDVGTHPSNGTGQERLVSKLGGNGLPVEGMADDNAASVGSPILVGGKYLSSASSNPVDADDVGHLLIDATRNLRTAVFSGDNAISIDSNGAVKLVGMENSVVNFKTGAAEGQEQYVACFGVTVPSATGPQEIKSTSIADTVSTVAQPSVTGLNVSQIGAYFGDFHSGGTDSDDITNIASFGIAIPTENGPAVVGRGSNTLPVSGTVTANVSFPSNQTVSGTVDVGNFPATQTVDGTVSVGNFPATQAVSGTVTANVSFPSTQTVDGTVSVGNFPSTQTVDGTVSVSNFPATQVVSGTVTANVSFPATQAVSGTVSVGNFPSTQTVSGTVNVGNFPSTQTVDGTVSVSNFPATQAVSGSVGISSSIPAGANRIGKVQIVTSGDAAVDSFGGGTQYTESDESSTGTVGNAQILIRKDSPGSVISSSNGDFLAQRGTKYGAAYTQILNSSGAFVDTFGGGQQYAESASIGSNATGTLQIGISKNTLGTISSLVDGDAVGIRATNKGAMWVSVDGTVTVDGSGSTQPVSGTVAVSGVSGTVTVDGSGSTQPVSGTVAVSGVSGTVTVDGSGVIQPVSGSVAVTGVSGTVTVDGSGVIQPVSGTVAVSSVSGTVTVDGSGSTQPVSGTVAVSGVSGTVAVDGSAVTQPVSGTVAVSGVTGTVNVDGSGVTQPVSGTVAVSGVTGTVTVDGSAVTQPVSGTVAVSGVTGTVTVDGSGVTQPVSGNVGVTSISAGANLIGDVGIQGRDTGGLEMYSTLDYVNTPVNVKSSAGTVYGITVFNMTASPFYIKFYDETVSVNRATHIPKLRFAVPANASSSGAGFVFNVPQGLAFDNQIQYAITTGVADTDTTGVSSGNAVVNIAYK